MTRLTLLPAAAAATVIVTSPLAAQIELRGTAMQANLAETGYGLVGVPFTDVTINDAFWAPRIATTRSSTLSHNFAMCETTGRLDNFRKASGQKEGEFVGRLYDDSDVYKALEGAVYQIAVQDDPTISKQIDDLIADIVAAQHEDGYINTYFTLREDQERWTNVRSAHELYCGGHLIEAAVAHYRATGERTLLDVAIKWADHVDERFGPEEDKLHFPPGHEEIELALVKLWRLTGDDRYFRLAQFFIEERGKVHSDGNRFGEYAQDQDPVTSHTEVVGHAVRAMYLYCAMADVAGVTGDEGYIEAMERVWTDLTQRKMYVTGGIGPSAANEGFTVAYDLPNETSYAETCASIGMALWNHRLSMLHRDAKYFDVFERVLYNGLLSGVSLKGDDFFYVNRLASSGHDRRSEWFECACCPPNVLRFLSSLSGYVYAQPVDGSERDVFVNLYVGSEAQVSVGSTPVTLTQTTAYPWEGRIELAVEHEADSVAMDLHLRIPAWARTHEVTVNGGRVTDAASEDGYLTLSRSWKSGDKVVIELPMPIERVYSHPSVESNVGRVALQRGPVVYCLEEEDNGEAVRSFVIPSDAPIDAAFDADLLGGITKLTGTAYVGDRAPWDDRTLYAAITSPQETSFTAIPYYSWANRNSGSMMVWAAQTPDALGPAPVSGITASASHVHEYDTCDSMHDRRSPESSADSSIPRHTFWPRKGSLEWVRYDFDEPRFVSGVDVYWFDDSSIGAGCYVPALCEIEFMREGQDNWIKLESEGKPVRVGVKADQFNSARFPSVKVQAMRLNIQLQEEHSGGVLEWTVNP